MIRETSSSTAVPPPQRPRKWYLYAVVALTGFTIGSWYRILGFTKKDSFAPFELIAKEPVSSTASLFTLKTKSNNVSTSAWKAGIWNVEFKQPQLQIVRAYTPLPPLPDDLDVETNSVQCLRFLIRKDASGGEMSSYIHRLPLGAEVELRGPNMEYRIDRDTQAVVFVAGGTGIAPAMQVAQAMFDGTTEEERAGKKLHILWANRRREDCRGGGNDVSAQVDPLIAVDKKAKSSWSSLIFGSKVEGQQVESSSKADVAPNLMVQQLNDLKAKYRDNVDVSYFVDEENTYIHSGTIQQMLADIQSNSEVKSTEIIVSGPPGFITYIAGPKLWKDGEEQQGPLGGRLAQVLGKDGKTNVKVWKV